MEPETSPNSILLDTTNFIPEETPQQDPISEKQPYLNRQAFLSGIPTNFHVVPIADFILYLLPSIKLSRTEQTEVFNLIEEKNYDASTSQWKDMTATGVESHAFRDFGKISNDIITAANTVLNGSRKSLVSFNSNGSQIPFSDRTKTSRPNGSASLQSSDRTPAHEFLTEANKDWWDRTFRSDEFDEDDSSSSKTDNIEKVLWSMHHVLQLDPCRRFTFGLTVENHMVRLWFLCRAYVVASHRFNFQTEWKTFATMTLSFGFANEEELGWDLSMRYSRAKRSHIITFDHKDYVIKKVLAKSRSDYWIGRATRVVLAQHDQDDPIIFKDVWAEVWQEREAKIQERILHDLQIYFATDRDRFKKVRSMFFTILGAEEIKLSDGTLDDTRRMITAQGIGELDLPSSTAPDNNPHPDSWARIFHRVHYRMKIKEYADPLSSVYDLGVCFSVMRSAIDLVYTLSLVGWVHRDLSLNNMYSFHGEFKLGDVEYAKKFTDERSGQDSDYRIGTRHFWSVEIESGYFLFAEPTREESLLNVPLRHLPLHEFESLWWIMMWIISMRVPVVPSIEWFPRSHEHLLSRIFPTRMGLVYRQNFFLLNGILRATDVIDVRLRPLLEKLIAYRRVLVDAFRRYENALCQQTGDKKLFLNAFTEYEDTLGDKETRLSFIEDLKRDLQQEILMTEADRPVLQTQMMDFEDIAR